MSENRNEDKSVAAGGSDSLEFSYADRDNRRISLRISGKAVLLLTSGLIALAGYDLQLRYGQLNVNGCGKLNPPGGQKC